MVKWRLTLTALMALAYVAPASAQSDLAIEGLTPDQEVIFLAGVAQGILAMNTYGLIKGSPLYCPPMDYAINAAEVRRLADLSLTGVHQSTIVAIAAVDALQQKFTCAETP